MAATPAPPIECREVTKRYGHIVGIDRVDLVVEAGSRTGLLGPNGAGKTTLLRLLVGILRPTSGDARLFGISVADATARRRVGFMPADPAFYPALTGLANLELLARLQGADTPDRGWALDRMGLDDADLHRAVGAYSSGMRQKLAIVQAVQHRPDLVIMDEPANRLDPFAHHNFEDLVVELARRGCAVVLSSHALAEVEAVCDRLAMIQSGRVLVHESTSRVLARAPRRLTVRYRRAPASLPPGLQAPELHDRRLDALIPGHRPDVLRAVLADQAVEDVLVQPATLEDVFLDLYKGQQP
ncbi:MAG TPA: ABC transporter ATP-binding protein [Acidimicrobiia bacterium]